MKKLLALLLVACMIFTLFACKPKNTKDPTGNPADDSSDETRETTPLRDDVQAINPFDPNNSNGGTTDNDGSATDSTEPVVENNDKYIDPEKFGGKELQVYGISSEIFDDIENMPGRANWLWMMRAAVDEWAYLNNVTITYEAEYDPNTILGAINSGERPDLLLFCMDIPGAANYGIARAFTDEEYKQISDICGNRFLDMMNFKGKSHGLVLPWSGCCMFYYNKTMFENYGVKSPYDYFMEDNWTWETMEKCLTDVTKDKDGNGKIDGNDTYGSGSLLFLGYPYELVEGEDGRLTGTIGTSEQFRKFAEIHYRATTETLMAAGPADKYCTTATPPQVASYVGDCSWWDYTIMGEEISNGDIVCAVPMPVYSKENPVGYNIYSEQTMSVMSSCDEPEATMALLGYLLRVGMRYMADSSMGLYSCNYEGIRGASAYSAGWKENFETALEERKAEFNEFEYWDQEYFEKVVNAVYKNEWIVNRKYIGKTTFYSQLSEMPPASAIPGIAAAQNSWITKYNSLYAK